jgi:hypothetical protein
MSEVLEERILNSEFLRVFMSKNSRHIVDVDGSLLVKAETLLRSEIRV